MGDLVGGNLHPVDVQVDVVADLHVDGQGGLSLDRFVVGGSDAFYGSRDGRLCATGGQYDREHDNESEGNAKREK